MFSGAGQSAGDTTTNGDPTQPRRASTSETRVISSPTSHQRGGSSTGATSLVNLTPLPVGGHSYANVNPAMNLAGNVQVMSVLEVPQVSNVFEQFDMGLMEGLPRGLFDWCEYPWLVSIKDIG